jgi:hypothetical protein
MYENWQDLAQDAMDRDPREFPIGIYSGGSFVLDNVRVFSWFKTIEDLCIHLREIEPRIHDLEVGDGLAEYQATVDPLLERLRNEGLTDELLSVISDSVNSEFAIEWWGVFSDLCNSDSEFSLDIRERFRDEDSSGLPIGGDEMEDFVTFLKDCGC